MLGSLAQIEEAVAAIRNGWARSPRAGIILGTGLGNLAQFIDQEAVLDYESIPHFPRSTALGHKGHLVCGTLAVCGLICFAVFAVKKLNGGLPMNRGRYLELLESRTVGRNLRLFLVKVAGRVVLLAATDQSASCVAEFTDEELPQEAVGAGAPAGAAFGSLLKRLAGVKG